MNKFDTEYLKAVHYCLAMKESIELKIDNHTEKLQAATEAYYASEKKLKQFGSRAFNIHSLVKAMLLAFLGALLAYRVFVLLFITPDLPAVTVILLYAGMLAAVAYGTHLFLKQSFFTYKKQLENQVLHYNNKREQSKKNIDNRIHELHEIQQRLQVLWGQK